MSDSEYDSVFEAVFEAMARWRPRPKAKIDLTQLLALPRGHQVMKLRSLRHLHTAEVAEALRKASDQHRFGDPPLALHLAQLAVYAARPATLEAGTDRMGGGKFELDVLAECLTTLGNVHRIVGETQKAPAYFKEATVVAHQGTGDPLIQAKIESHSAVLFADRGQLPEALFLYLHCLDVYRQLGEEELAHVIQISIGQVQLRSGRPVQALNAAFGCLGEIDPAGETRVAQSAVLLIAQARLDLGDARRALRDARSVQEMCTEEGEEGLRVRGEWIEARAQLALGDWQDGVAGLDEARDKLLQVGALGAAALAHLELALAHADACQWDEAATIARQAFGTLAAAGLEGQALLALRTVAHAADEQELTRQVLRRAIGTVTTGG